MREPGRMADRRGQQGREAAKRIRWTRADAEGVLAQWSESGGSLYAHARRHDLPEQRLYY